MAFLIPWNENRCAILSFYSVALGNEYKSLIKPKSVLSVSHQMKQKHEGKNTFVNYFQWASYKKRIWLYEQSMANPSSCALLSSFDLPPALIKNSTVSLVS